MTDFCIFLFSFFVIYAAQSQDCELQFRSPINYTTKLSGSYGEPRTQHFHAGIDYKQKYGIPHDSVFAVADGYISRINVQPDGYGNSLYIDHNCNRTSVYGHLYEFAPPIKKYMRDTMTSLKTHELSHIQLSNAFPVNKGDFIGIMGSTGRSSGPHLHFEIRNTKSDTPINPALVGLKPKDQIAPVLRGIMLYELSPDNEELDKQYYHATKNGHNNYKLKGNTILTNAFKIGIGLRAYDTMNGASNHNGIYSLKMEVDGDAVYSFSMDSIAFDQSIFIHSHMDYEEKMNNRYVTKCFKNPGNQLNIYHTDKNQGVIYPFEFKDSEIRIEVQDIEGNSAVLEFAIKRTGKRMSSQKIIKEKFRVKPQDSLVLSIDKATVIFSPGTFCQPTALSFVDSKDSIMLKQDSKIPLFKNFKLSFQIDTILYPKEKYTFLTFNDKGETERYRGKWESQYTLVTFFNKLANYSIGIDTIQPKIEVLSVPNRFSKRVKFQISDNYQAVYKIDRLKYTVLLDGQWKLCQEDAKSGTIWFDIEENRTGQSRLIEVTVEDASKNQSSLTRTIVF